MATNIFPCTKCGICCRNIDKVPELKDYDLGNGTCMYLKDNLCSIYSTRPDICRVDVMYEKRYKNTLSYEEYEKLNLEACKELQSKLV